METINLPLVTVVTVTYNSSKYVRDAIESVLSSSYHHFELIIGDDCSIDNTWDIIRSYKDSRIRTYRNEANAGEYANRSKAIAMAKGKYLIFIDGDDMIYPHGLEFMVRMLEAFPQCAMALMCWFRNNLMFPVVVTSEQFFVGEYFGNGFLGTAFSNVLFNTEILKEEGLSLKYKAGDDYIRYKIAAKYSSLLINDGLTWWRETPGQASQQLAKSLEPFEMRLEFLNSKSCPLSNDHKILARQNLILTLSKIVLKKILKFQVDEAIMTMWKFKIPLISLLSSFKPLVKIDPFKSFSPSNPYKMSFRSNPYSRG